jgi:hypothetical protein
MARYCERFAASPAGGLGGVGVSAGRTSLETSRIARVGCLATLHGHLSRSRDLELQGREHEAWLRRGLLVVLALVILAALLNVVGQRTTTSTAVGSAATLTVDAPERLRGGLIFQARFEIAAHQEIDHPRLVLAPGWTEGMTLNSSEPQPTQETSHGDRLEFDFDSIAAGSTFTFWSEWSVNPVNVGHRSQDVALYDGPRVVASIDRAVTIFP